MSRLIRPASWLALWGPALVVVAVILRYGVNVPYAEEWDFVLFFSSLERGTLRWIDLWAPHNEHRVPIPKLVMLLLAPLTRWNLRAEMLLSATLAFLSLLMLLALARPALEEARPWGRVWATFTMSLLVFSLAQVGNWLWGWQLTWFITVFSAILSVTLATWSLERERPWPYVLATALAAFVCQWSLASGTVIWPMSALVLAFHPQRGRLLGFWLAAALGSTLFYAMDYTRPPGSPSLGVALAEPVLFVRYIGFYLAGPFGRNAGIGLAVAAIFVGFAGIVARRHWRRPALFVPWLAIGGFALANAMLTGLGRLGMGVHQAQTTRYVTISLLLAAAVVPLGVVAFSAAPAGRWSPLRRPVGVVGAAVLTVWVIATDVRRLDDIRDFNRMMTTGRDCVFEIEKAPDSCLMNIHPNPATVRLRAPELAGLKLSMFAREMPR